MSEDKKTAVKKAATTEVADVTTLNTHATLEPLTAASAGGEETGLATPDNTHATDEKA